MVKNVKGPLSHPHSWQNKNSCIPHSREHNHKNLNFILLYHSVAGVLNLDIIDIVGFFEEEDCPVPYRIFSSIPGFYPLDASGIIPAPSCEI